MQYQGLLAARWAALFVSRSEPPKSVGKSTSVALGFAEELGAGEVQRSISVLKGMARAEEGQPGSVSYYHSGLR